jgi:hypothetical protein
MSERYLNRAEAAKAIGKSEPTLDGYLKAGKFPNAKKTQRGKRLTWQIPLTDLVAAGFMDSVTPKPETATASALPLEVMSVQEQLSALQELATLRAENAQLRDRLADAERARQDLISAYAPRIETAERQAQRRRFWFGRG